MNYYNSKFPLLFAPKGVKRWAITIGQRTWYSVPQDQVDAAWAKHENIHKDQWKREGFLMGLKYIYYHFRYGYDRNPYEIEASR
jgi:hypothetical protein